MATFTGTSGSDIADATTGTITGFTGGTVAELQDAAGDTFSGADGSDTIVAGDGADDIGDFQGPTASLSGGAGNDRFNIGSVTFGAGSTIDGGADIDALDTNGDLRNIVISNVEILRTNFGTPTARADQFEQFDAIYLRDDSLFSTINLNLAATGGATVLDISDELNSGGPRGVNLNGTSDNETITTGDGSDNIAAAGGNDVVNGGLGSDVLSGNDGDDVLNGGDGNDTLTGETGNDTINGGDGADDIGDFQGATVNLSGGAGNDRLNIGSTTFGVGSTIDGGADIDALDANGDLRNVVISNVEILRTNFGTPTARADQFEQFDAIYLRDDSLFSTINLNLAATGGATVLDISDELNSGGPRGVNLNGTSDNETITTGDGNDNIAAAGGNDVVNGGLGSDSLNGNDGDDVLNGGDGNDILTGETGNDTLNGGDGADSIDDFQGVTTNLNGGAGNDRLNIGSTTFGVGSTIDGSADIDALDANGDLRNVVISNVEILRTNFGTPTARADQFEQFDVIYLRDDSLFSTINLNLAVTGGATVLDLSDELNSGGPRGVNLNGTSDNETITTGNGNDNIDAGGGNDVVNGGLGSDALNGGAGVNTVSYASLTSGVFVNLAGSGASDATGVDTLSNFSNIIGSGFNDTLRGSVGVNVITGGLGNDSLTGLSGADTFRFGRVFGFGADTITDFLQTTLSAAGHDLIDLAGLGLTFASLNIVYGGGDATITFAGHAGDQITLNGISGGLQTSDFKFSDGLPVLFEGTPGADVANAETGVLTGFTGGTLADLQDEVGDTINGGDSADVVIAGAGNDVIFGGAGDDLLNGGDGDDAVFGESGNDTFIGGLGDDFYAGGNNDSSSTISYAAALNGITALLAFEEAFGAEIGFDQLFGIRNVTGGAGADSIGGNLNANVLIGGNGNDTLDGADGDDTLDGGAGNDVFQFQTFGGGTPVTVVLGGADTDTIEIVNLANLTAASFSSIERVSLDGHGIFAAGQIANGLAANLELAGNGEITFEMGTATILDASAFQGFAGPLLSVTGDNDAESITGWGNGEAVHAGGGNDTIFGSLGDDTYDGGDGSDIVSYAGATHDILVNLNFVVLQAFGEDIGVDTFTAIENVTGGAGNDTITGDDNANILTGGDGADRLAGGFRADALNGGAGNDTLVIGNSDEGISADTFNGDGGFDVVELSGREIDFRSASFSGIESLNIREGGHAILNTSQIGAGLAADLDIEGSGAPGTVTFHLGAATDFNANLLFINGPILVEIFGDNDAETITAGFTNFQSIDGGGGNDTIISQAFGATITGGAGNDIFKFTNIVPSTITDFASLAASGISRDVIDLIDTAFTGTFGDLVITYAGGNATIDFGSGPQLFLTGVAGGLQADDFRFSVINPKVFFGTAGVDVADAAGAGVLSGFTGGTIADLQDTAGDTFFASGANDSIAAGSGNDVINGEAGNDRINGSGGDDSIDGGAGNDNLNGDDGDDSIDGGANNDSLDGGAGDDTIDGGAGNDNLNGGAGVNTVSYESATTSVQVNLLAARSFSSGTGSDTLVGFANIIGSDFGDVLTGDSANILTGDIAGNVISGGLGRDTIDGGASGNDTLNGGADDDRITIRAGVTSGAIDGGTGIDVLQAFNVVLTGFALSNLEVLETSGGTVVARADQFESFDSIRVSANAPAAQVSLFLAASGDGTVLDLVDELNDGGGPRSVRLVGTPDAETFITGNGADTVLAGAGNDSLIGGDGNDSLFGDLNNDTINGGDGDDFLSGGDGNDELDGGAGDDRIDDFLGGNTAISAGAGNDTITIGANFLGRIEGGDGTDTLVTGANNLNGFLLSDIEILHTGGGKVIGFAQQFEVFDTIRVDAVSTSATVQLELIAGLQPAIVDLADELNTGGGPRGVRLTGSSDSETITTGEGNDSVTGLGGNDIIRTGGGNDTINNLTGATATIDAGAGSDAIFISANFSGSIDGGADTDTLTGNGNLSNLTLANLEILHTARGAVTARASQFEMFDTIRADGVSLTAQVALTLAATGGATILDLTDELTSGGGPRGVNLIGSADSESITTAGGDDVINSGGGNDAIFSGGGNDRITDTIGTSTTIQAGAGDDAIDLGSNIFSSSLVNGGDGIDTLSVLGSNLTGLSIVAIEVLQTGGGAVTARAGQFEAFDTIRAGATATSTVRLNLAATGGATTLDIMDELNSGGGPRGVILNGTLDDETITTGDGNDAVNGIGGDDTIDTGNGNDSVTFATGGVNVIRTGAGLDTITIVSGGIFTSASGSVDGGADIDFLEAPGRNLTGLVLSNLEVLNTKNGLVVAFASQFDAFDIIRRDGISFTGDVQLTLAASGIATVLDLSDELNAGGGPRGVRLTGSSDNETVRIGDGNSTVNLGAGDDAIVTGNGNNIITDTAGNDTIITGTGNDSVTDSAGTSATIVTSDGADTIDISNSLFTSGELNGGTDGNVDTLIAKNANLAGLNVINFEVLHLGNGTVTAFADQFDHFDTIRRDAGSVTANVRLTLTASGHATVLDLSDELNSGGGPRGVILTGAADNEVITTGAGADTVSAGDGADSIVGGAGADSLLGGNGNDTLIGGAGADKVTGGANADRFVYDTADLAVGEEITDFSHSSADKIDLSAIDANATTGADDAFSFIGLAAFGHVAGQLHYTKSGGNLFLSGDTNGDGVADFTIKLDALASIVSGDFIL